MVTSLWMFLLDCIHGDIRLAVVSNHLGGRVEVCFDGVWGRVCNSGWNTASAMVACRQLGFSVSGILDKKSEKTLISHSNSG